MTRIRSLSTYLDWTVLSIGAVFVKNLRQCVVEKRVVGTWTRWSDTIERKSQSKAQAADDIMGSKRETEAYGGELWWHLCIM